MAYFPYVTFECRIVQWRHDSRLLLLLNWFLASRLHIIGSLRNHDGDAEDNVDWKINLCFIYESRDTLKLFALFIASKAIAKLNPERNDQFEIKFKKLAVVAHVLQKTQDLVISRCCFAEDVKEMYQESKRTCTAIVLAIKSFVRGRSRCRCRRGFVNSLIKRTLRVGSKIWILCSRGKNNISREQYLPRGSHWL